MKLEILREAAIGATTPRPPILFVHGAYCSAEIWATHYLRYFAEQGYDCQALSLRGHGGSEGMLSWSGLSDYIDDVLGLAASCEMPPILIGHALGGLVIQHCLTKQKISAAVLLAPVPPSGISSSIMHMTLQTPDVLWRLSLLQSLGPDAVSSEVMARAWLSPSPSPGAAEKLMSYLQRESPRVIAELLAPSQPIPPRGPNKPPILVIGGDADLFSPVVAFRETATFFGADLELLKGAPHGLMIDEKFWQPSADVVLKWLRGVI